MSPYIKYFSSVTDIGLYAVDGLTLSFDNNKEIRKDLKVKNNNLNYRKSF